MLRAYQRHLYRDRRRLALGWVLLIASAALAGTSLPPVLPWLRTEFLVALPLLLAIPAITIFVPKHRHWIEIVVLGTFLHLVLGYALPGSVYDHRGPLGYSMQAYIAFGLTLLTTRIGLYGHWSDRFAPRHRPTARAVTRSALDARQLWYGLVPTPGHAERSPDAQVVSIDYADPSRNTVRLLTWEPGSPPGEVILHIYALAPMRRVRLRMEVISGLRDDGGEGITEFRLDDRGTHRRLILTHRLDRAVPRRMLRGWLDDTLGRILDTRLDAVEASVAGRAHRFARPGLTDWYDEPRAVSPGRSDRIGGYRTAYGRRASDQERAAIEEASTA